MSNMNGTKVYSDCWIWCKNMWNLYCIVNCIWCLSLYWHIVTWWIQKVVTWLESFILVLGTLLVSSSTIMIKCLKIIQNDQQRILKKNSSGKSETTSMHSSFFHTCFKESKNLVVLVTFVLFNLFSSNFHCVPVICQSSNHLYFIINRLPCIKSISCWSNHFWTVLVMVICVKWYFFNYSHG